MAPTLTTMNKLANGFGVDVSTLLEGLNERSPSRCLSQLTDFMSMRTEAEVNALLRIATALFDRETMAPPVVSMVS